MEKVVFHHDGTKFTPRWNDLVLGWFSLFVTVRKVAGYDYGEAYIKDMSAYYEPF